MRKSRVTEEQIVAALQLARSGGGRLLERLPEVKNRSA